jgi:hypothetical protein
MKNNGFPPSPSAGRSRAFLIIRKMADLRDILDRFVRR